MEKLNNFLLILSHLLLTYGAEYPYTKFPDGFQFGVATAAHQIEGAWNLSGKTENCWDRLSHSRPELIADGTTGDIAVDSYNRYHEDVEALKNLGVDYYRFSLSWARILPTGRIDQINQEGIKYYNNLIDLLLKNNIQPLVTLFHWDLPQTLQDLGGWTNPIVIEYFEDYSQVCFEQFGDRVKFWITFNEPWEICEDGYGDDKKAPALSSHGIGDYLCGHNLLKSHAVSYHLYNNTFRAIQKGRIMISINSIWYIPADLKDKILVETAEAANQFKFGWFAHPIFSKEGGYPKQMIERIDKKSKEEGLKVSRLPIMDETWKNMIKGSSDALGINHYTTHLIIKADASNTSQNPSWIRDLGATISTDIGTDSASEWLRVISTYMLRWANNEYNNPEILITENGFSDRGTLEDDDRINYYNEYLSELLKCIHNDHINITAYTAWTLMDNFEWRAGFSERFGFYYVDITKPDLPRFKKKSADVFKNIIKTRSISGTINEHNYDDVSIN